MKNFFQKNLQGKKEKPNVLTGVLIGVLATLLVGIGVFFAWTAWYDPSEGISQAIRDVVSDESADPALLVTDSYEGWEAYSNSTYGFLLRYPSDQVPQPNNPTADNVVFGNVRFSVAEDVTTDTAYAAFTQQPEESLGDHVFQVFSRAGDDPQMAYVIRRKDMDLVFSAPTSEQSVVLSMLRSLQFLSEEKGSAVAGLDVSPLLFQQNVRDKTQVTGVTSDGLHETTHLSLSSSGETVVGVDVNKERTQLVYATPQRTVLRDLKTGRETVLIDALEAASYAFTDIALSPDGRYVASPVVFPNDEQQSGRVSIYDTQTSSVVPDDLNVAPFFVRWIGAKTFLFVSETGVGTYNVVDNTTTSFQQGVFAEGNDRSARIRAAAMNPSGTRLAVLVSLQPAEGEAAPDSGRVAALYIVNTETDELAHSLLLHTSVDEPHDVPERFGVVWLDDASRLVVSVHDEVWTSSLEEEDAFGVPAEIVSRGRVVGRLSSGEVMLEQQVFDSAGESVGSRVRLLDASAERTLYVSEIQDRVHVLASSLE